MCFMCLGEKNQPCAFMRMCPNCVFSSRLVACICCDAVHTTSHVSQIRSQNLTGYLLSNILVAVM